MRVAIIGALLMFGLAGGTGCSSFSYKGASPSARYFCEDPPAFKRCYLGMNFKFGIDRQSEYYHPYESSTAIAQIE